MLALTQSFQLAIQDLKTGEADKLKTIPSRRSFETSREGLTVLEDIFRNLQEAQSLDKIRLSNNSRSIVKVVGKYPLLAEIELAKAIVSTIKSKFEPYAQAEISGILLQSRHKNIFYKAVIRRDLHKSVNVDAHEESIHMFDRSPGGPAEGEECCLPQILSAIEVPGLASLYIDEPVNTVTSSNIPHSVVRAKEVRLVGRESTTKCTGCSLAIRTLAQTKLSNITVLNLQCITVEEEHMISLFADLTP